MSSNSTIVQAWWPSNYTNNEDFQRAVDQLTHKRKLTRNETALFLVKEILEEARAWVAKIAIIITPKYSLSDFINVLDASADHLYRTGFAIFFVGLPWDDYPVRNDKYDNLPYRYGKIPRVTSILKRVCEKAGTCSEYFVLFYLLIIIKARLFWPLSIFSIFSVFVFSCLRFCTFCT